ncbi:MAG: AAA family ATPase, partial [Firmicutes bacterium]|nr:AAA family ATPase [Bacillota bacterium]
MRIKEIQVEGLFGMFDHKIQLNTDKQLTILTGPNGFGKTTILRIIAKIFTPNIGKWYSLLNTHFKRMKIAMEDQSYILIEKLNSENILVEIYDEGTKVTNTKNIDPSILKIKEIMKTIETQLPFIEQINEDTWYDNI